MVAPKGPTIQELSAGLSLAGFLELGDQTQAVLMDRKTGSTHYLNEGDTIQGLKVESVGDGKVVLSLDGETITLRL